MLRTEAEGKDKGEGSCHYNLVREDDGLGIVGAVSMESSRQVWKCSNDTAGRISTSTECGQGGSYRGKQQGF